MGDDSTQSRMQCIRDGAEFKFNLNSYLGTEIINIKMKKNNK